MLTGPCVWRLARRVPGPGGGSLISVAATSARNAWAVGQTYVGNPLILHWNGTAWNKVHDPAGGAYLEGVAASSARTAWVVGGGVGLSPAPGRSVLLRWNGAVFKRVRSPASRAALVGVTAISARSAWAVGATGTFPSGRQHKTVILHWNGRTWTRLRSPTPADAGGAVLIGVTARSARAEWAVGAALHDHRSSTLILHWNGTAWK